MDEAAPILNICGQRVGLGPLRREHLPLYVRWLNDLNTADDAGAGGGLARARVGG